MAIMTTREYEEAKKIIQNVYRFGSGTKEAYIGYLRMIIALYDDGYECAKKLDAWNSKWTIFGKYL